MRYAVAICAAFLLLVTLGAKRFQKLPDAEEAGRQSERREGKEPQATPVKADDGSPAQCDDCNKREHREQIRFLVEVMTLVVVIVYTGIQGCQLNVVSDQEKRQLRAYVGETDLSNIKITTDQATIAQVTIKNFGLTPTYDVRVYSATRLVDVTRLSSFVVPNAIDNAIHRFALFPGQEIKTQFSIAPIPYEDAIRFGNRETIFLIFGDIDYTDTFGRFRSTKFCHQYIGPGAKGELCATHNDGS